MNDVLRNGELMSTKAKETEKSIKGTKKRKAKHKPYAIGITKKQLIGYTTATIVAACFIFIVMIPAMQGSLHFLIVLSGSMSPKINMGDVVITSSASPEEIQVGDVITFKQPSAADPNRCVTHRVINITTEGNSLRFQTKGDANEDPDMELVDSSALIGKVVLSIPYVGYIPHYVKTPIGFIIFIALPGTLLIVSEVRNIIKSQRNDDGAKKKELAIRRQTHSNPKTDNKQNLFDTSDIHKKIDEKLLEK